MDALEHAEQIMVALDVMEEKFGFDATMLSLLHVVACYIHMHCEEKDFKKAVDQASAIILNFVIDNEEHLVNATKVVQ